MIATPAPLHYQNLHADIERYVAIVLGACFEPQDCLALIVLLHRRWVVLP